jgi:hypothetical protein
VPEIWFEQNGTSFTAWSRSMSETTRFCSACSSTSPLDHPDQESLLPFLQRVSTRTDVTHGSMKAPKSSQCSRRAISIQL